MNEETISKVLTGETDIAKMSHDDFVKMLKCLDRMYFSRVMNCVDGTGKFDKEWAALSCIFSRVVEAITEKPSGNSAALREALVEVEGAILEDEPGRFWLADAEVILHRVQTALAEPARNCDVKYADGVEMYDAFKDWCKAKGHTMEPMLAYDAFEWLLGTAKG